MLLRWFDSREAVAFAKTIINEFNTVFPPGSNPEVGKLTRPKDFKKLERILEKIFTFTQEKQLNFYVKSRFLNALMWELKEHGYDETFVKRFMETITPRL
ncbi:MAG TPA: hypothetical protein DEP36_04610 [Gammaproteobacteria bacterium]|nr:hypothetical protein [Gammaproteobacteria bacterium]HRF44092.1 hypothetical protein [Candidatus Competibacteraceae bacterium]